MLWKNISRKGPRNCRSLGYARDDKKERVVVKRGSLPRDRAVVGVGVDPLVTALPFSDRPLLATALSFLSSRAKPRDLQFAPPATNLKWKHHPLPGPNELFDGGRYCLVNDRRWWTITAH
jgi:hypothetical protein